MDINLQMIEVGPHVHAARYTMASRRGSALVTTCSLQAQGAQSDSFAHGLRLGKSFEAA